MSLSPSVYVCELIFRVTYCYTVYQLITRKVPYDVLGAMERFDKVHSKDYATMSWRRDWEGDVAAVHEQHRTKCPNVAKK